MIESEKFLASLLDEPVQVRQPKLVYAQPAREFNAGKWIWRLVFIALIVLIGWGVHSGAVGIVPQTASVPPLQVSVAPIPTQPAAPIATAIVAPRPAVIQ